MPGYVLMYDNIYICTPTILYVCMYVCMYVFECYIVCMRFTAFGPASADPNSERRISPLVNWGTLECVYPRYPQIFQLSVDDSSRFDSIILLLILPSVYITEHRMCPK